MLRARSSARACHAPQLRQPRAADKYMNSLSPRPRGLDPSAARAPAGRRGRSSGHCMMLSCGTERVWAAAGAIRLPPQQCATSTTAHRDRLVMQPAPSPHRGAVTYRVAAPPPRWRALRWIAAHRGQCVHSPPPCLVGCWRTAVKMPGETAKVRRTLHCISCDTTLVSLHHLFL